MEEEITLTRHQRYHALNREKRISYQLERYYNNPDVIAKREERERKKAEKEAEKEAQKAFSDDMVKCNVVEKKTSTSRYYIGLIRK